MKKIVKKPSPNDKIAAKRFQAFCTKKVYFTQMKASEWPLKRLRLYHTHANPGRSCQTKKSVCWLQSQLERLITWKNPHRFYIIEDNIRSQTH